MVEELQPLAGAALLLSLERLCYIWIARRPRAFAHVWAAHGGGLTDEPIDAVFLLFCVFKVLQAGVFFAWCYVYGDGVIWPVDAGPLAIVAGTALIGCGQSLTALAFYQLGRAGVFYGNRFGHDVEWCRAFPYSVMSHPQYVGAVLSIWGFFVVMRFPNPDWVLLPVLETAYYAIGARLER